MNAKRTKIMNNEIKVGDKVRIANNAPSEYRYGFNYRLRTQESEVVGLDDDGYMATIVPMCVNDKDLWFQIPTKYLIKVDAEAKEPKFKKGDKVRFKKIYTVVSVDDGQVFIDSAGNHFDEDCLELYTEPTSPTIKVGDFVRVLENLHEPFCLDVERHLEITNIPPHAVSQKEWKVISIEVRQDCAGRIYTLKHDDSFIYNIPEDCVERVEPTEQTEAEKKPNVGYIKIPVEVDLTDSYWEAYAADLAKEIAVKSMEKSCGCDPERIADYAVSVAKAVVENLKKK